MIIYHGSQTIIKKPIFGFGSQNNDYGLGFYCTESDELAKEWSCPELKNGFSNRYELDLTDLKVLDLNGDGYNILNWIAILLKNRNFPKRSPISRQATDYLLEEFLPNINGYDVITGYRADDSYFTYAKDFLNNTISVDQLSRAMKLGELGEQIVLMTEKAFENLTFLDYKIVDANIYYYKRAEREARARKAYLSNHGRDFMVSDNDLFVRDIITRKVKNNDQCLR